MQQLYDHTNACNNRYTTTVNAITNQWQRQINQINKYTQNPRLHCMCHAHTQSSESSDTNKRHKTIGNTCTIIDNKKKDINNWQ